MFVPTALIAQVIPGVCAYRSVSTGNVRCSGLPVSTSNARFYAYRSVGTGNTTCSGLPVSTGNARCLSLSVQATPGVLA